jgi:CheY-like chemotaxis protein
MTKKLIILAEDDADDRMIFEDAFEKFNTGNLELQVFEDGLELIRFMSNASDDVRPRLFVLDQNMPRMTGRETLTALKEDVRYKDVPVVIYTTYPDKSIIHEFEQQGAGMVVSKPDTFDGFRDMVHAFLTRYLEA